MSRRSTPTPQVPASFLRRHAYGLSLAAIVAGGGLVGLVVGELADYSTPDASAVQAAATRSAKTPGFESTPATLAEAAAALNSSANPAAADPQTLAAARSSILRSLDPESPASLPQFETALRSDPDPESRLIAIAGLRMSGMKGEQAARVREALESAAKDGDIYVKTAARDALTDIEQQYIETEAR